MVTSALQIGARRALTSKEQRNPASKAATFTISTTELEMKVDQVAPDTTQSQRVAHSVASCCDWQQRQRLIGSIMPIPDFNIDGLLPPFVGETPAHSSSDMSPYRGSTPDVVRVLGNSERRKSILRGWLLHRKALRAIGFNKGFQWIDGSFVEKEKEPKDIDTMTFFRRPAHVKTLDDLARLWQANTPVLGRGQVKRSFHVDFLSLDLDGDGEILVDMTRYYLSLFSHRRKDLVWKGMIQVSLDSVAEDDQALHLLGPEPISSETEAGDNI